jgi:archaellum component FlaG (FlaF/FlaG flagellin family)
VNITNLVDNWSSAAPSPTVSRSATSLAFGSVAVGSAGATKTLTIKNTGSVAVTFKSGGITLTGADGAVFSKTTTCGSYLSLGGSCTITVTFKPKAVGSASGTLSIADNAAGSPQTVSLSGTGTSAS